MVQNEIVDIFRDDLAALTDEADGGGGGSRKESLVSEAQSFTHLTYSKNKVGAQGPGRKDCTDERGQVHQAGSRSVARPLAVHGS